MSILDQRYCFIVDWFDSQAGLIRNYQMFYYPNDNTAEMYDVKLRRIFLRRSSVKDLSPDNLYIGSNIDVMSRQLTIVGYGDEKTRKEFGNQREKTLAIIMPCALDKMGQILDEIYKSGLLVTKLKMTTVSSSVAAEFYSHKQSTTEYNDLIRELSNSLIVAIELRGECALDRFKELCGPCDPAVARSQAPLSLRARFGKSIVENGVHCSSHDTANKELALMFGQLEDGSDAAVARNTAKFTESTCCVIKPHAVKMGNAGSIINCIMNAGFEISAINIYQMERANAQEFYEIYRGVVQEYTGMVDELSSGPCIVMEIRATNCPAMFREMVGPADPEIARHLRPRSLRAMFGKDKIQNAVHCTDLVDDALLEVEYFFKVLN